jgi:hypothetical protein
VHLRTLDAVEEGEETRHVGADIGDLGGVAVAHKGILSLGGLSDRLNGELPLD